QPLRPTFYRLQIFPAGSDSREFRKSSFVHF
ncbi:MAG: hypothetical protein ACI9ON_002454, partial [Limisphaerales bacterium]